MLGRKHHIPDTSKVRETRPIQWFKLIWVKRFREVVKEAVTIFRGCADQGVTDDYTKLAVNAPVNEKPKPLILKPLQSLLLIQRTLFWIIYGSK